MSVSEDRLRLHNRVTEILVDAAGPESESEANELRADFGVLVDTLFDSLQLDIVGNNGEWLTIEVNP